MGELVSVVIPTFNSEKEISRCLESIKGQSYDKIEIIVVDKFSHDKTGKIAKKYSAKLILDKGERAKAKNIGIANAKGEYIFFIDSDMELEKHVISECVERMSPKTGGVVIPERSIGKTFWVKVRDYERSFYSGSTIESARFFRLETARKAGGFDEEVIFFEEAALPDKIEKLGFDVRTRIKSRILHHEEGFKLGKWLKKKYYYGKTATRSKHTSVFYRLKLFFANKRFYSKPILMIGILILKTLETIATVLGKIS
ncbi:glycosyltransferase [Candidatus Micrarchaeota archaeon]|nr:glycosyltransferase [Candidatus Micrarchaeota archaeon]MBU1681233.1 glycosyltransferase [Candidatus Micrarchaeota archaeon]